MIGETLETHKKIDYVHQYCIKNKEAYWFGPFEKLVFQCLKTIVGKYFLVHQLGHSLPILEVTSLQIYGKSIKELKSYCKKF